MKPRFALFAPGVMVKDPIGWHFDGPVGWYERRGCGPDEREVLVSVSYSGVTSWPTQEEAEAAAVLIVTRHPEWTGIFQVRKV